MVLDRSRKGLLVICAVVLIGLFALGALNERQAVEPNARLKELMTERYEILKTMVESTERLLAAGMVSISEWRDAKVALYTAQADLAADTAERIKVYEQMVESLRTSERWAQKSADAGRMTESEVLKAKLATVEAQITLEKLRLPQSR